MNNEIVITKYSDINEATKDNLKEFNIRNCKNDDWIIFVPKQYWELKIYPNLTEKQKLNYAQYAHYIIPDIISLGIRNHSNYKFYQFKNEFLIIHCKK